MNQPAQPIAPLHVKSGRRRMILRLGCLKLESSVRPLSVVVVHVFEEHSVEMSGGNDKNAVETLFCHRTNPPLCIGVCLGSSKRGPNDANPFRPEHLVEGSRVLGVAVVDQEPNVPLELGTQVPRLLGHP